MSSVLIDVWNIRTFDNELLDELQLYAQLVQNYMNTEKRHFLEYVHADRRRPISSNPFHGHYLWLIEHIEDYMKSRSIRAWHYTRLTDDEVEGIRHTGLYPSTLETIRSRLDARVAAGDFSADVADALFAASPFQNKQQFAARNHQFWMTSHPLGTDDSGVELLLGNWGGESVYFWLQDNFLEGLVSCIGRPRVLEIVVPIDATNHAYSAAKAVLGAFGLTLGCSPDRGAFDLYCKNPLGPEKILAIHTEGETFFTNLGSITERALTS